HHIVSAFHGSHDPGSAPMSLGDSVEMRWRSSAGRRPSGVAAKASQPAGYTQAGEEDAALLLQCSDLVLDCLALLIGDVRFEPRPKECQPLGDPAVAVDHRAHGASVEAGRGDRFTRPAGLGKFAGASWRLQARYADEPRVLAAVRSHAAYTAPRAAAAVR